jgi:hypothetical protein
VQNVPRQVASDDFAILDDIGIIRCALGNKAILNQPGIICTTCRSRRLSSLPSTHTIHKATVHVEKGHRLYRCGLEPCMEMLTSLEVQVLIFDSTVCTVA